MTGRRAYSLPPHAIDSKPERGKCVTAICFSWKVITCVVSHVTLVLMVVSYCVGGAYLFQSLEKQHEIEVKKDIHNMRRVLTEKIWSISDNATYLSESDWVNSVSVDLADFEMEILTAMKNRGWDGNEDISKSQWTFIGSLFYSIIVITTIGYGHIAPRTDWGKVTTIFYAIIGIPLMLLCLSNIGDIMATSFRFVYWRVCCYICTRSSRHSRHHRHRSRHRSMRSYRYSSRSQPPPFRRSMKLTQRSVNDSGLGTSLAFVHHAYSDPELRAAEINEYYNHGGSSRRHPHRHSSRHAVMNYEADDPYNDDVGNNRNSQRLSGRQRNRFRMQERHTIERERHLSRSKQNVDSIEDLNRLPPTPATAPPMAKRSFSVRSMRAPHSRREDPSLALLELRELNPLQSQTLPRGRSVPHNVTARGRAKSVDPRVLAAQYDGLIDEDIIRKTPIIPNRYALDDFNRKETRIKSSPRSQSMPRSSHHHHKSKDNPRDSGRNERDVSQQRHQHQDQHHHHHDDDYHRGQFQQERSHRLLTPQENQQRRPSFNRQQARYGNRLELPELTSSTTNRSHRGRSRSPRPELPELISPTTNRTRRGHSRSPRPDENAMNHRRERSPPRPCDYENTYDERSLDGYDIEAAYDDYPPHEIPHRERRQRRERSEKLPPSPRIMSPMGFAVKRQIRPRPSYDYDEDSFDEWDDYYDNVSSKNRPVPIWLCVFLVISYILGGAALFSCWEKWSFLDSAYFCFITLTTIGFGDFVPAKGVKEESQQSIAFCSLYLLFGISLLAMSFNLVQEEFIANVKELARRLGILKDEDDEDDD